MQRDSVRLPPFARTSPLLLVLSAAACGPLDTTATPLAGGTEPELVLESGAGEGPAWHPDGFLLFSGHGSILRWDGSADTPEVLRQGAGTNGLLFDRKGRLLACEPGQRRVTRTDLESGEVTVLTGSFGGKRYNTPNDITIDADGRIFFSDPRYGSRDGMELLDADGRAIEGVYRIDLDGSVARVITHEVDRPNGVLVSKDGRYLFVADNNNNDVGGARKLWRFDLSAGEVDLGSKRLLFDWLSSRGPDGMVQDELGNLYVAGGLNKDNLPAETADPYRGGIYVFTPGGRRIDFVAISRDEVTNCTFGGPERRTLYVTAGGTLWAIKTRVRGWLPWPP